MLVSSIAQKDFSKKTISLLAEKGVNIINTVAVPAFDGDVYFSGVAYTLEFNGLSFMRTHHQILCMAVSSWNPNDEGAI